MTARTRKTKNLQGYEGLLFPKKKVRKRKPRKESILQEKDGRCYLCMKSGDYRIHPVTHKHHVYPGALRKISDENGFTVNLCVKHHEFDAAAVHENQDNMRRIQRDCQRKYEETHSREEFMNLVGRNYLD